MAVNLRYRILNVDENEKSFVVRFFTDKITEDDLAIHDGQGNIARTDAGYPVSCRTDYNVNIWTDDANGMTDEEIDAYILQHAPVDWLTLKEKIADPSIDTSLTKWAAKVGTAVEKDNYSNAAVNDPIDDLTVDELIDGV